MTNNKTSLLHASIPILFLIVFLVLNVVYFEDDASYGPNQIALLLSAALASVFAVINKMSWMDLKAGIMKSIDTAMPSILILLIIGSLAGTWLLSGIVPAMVYYGLDILTPKVFLFASCIVCMVISLATGSSWSTAATVGVALMAIGKAMGINPGIVAGAVISGAYFGDKMSPLSDTTNLAPGMVGTDLFTHIRYMMYTTIPSIIITLIIFLIMGFSYSSTTDANEIAVVQEAISARFNLNPLLFLVPIIVIVLIIKKVPALPALLSGTLLGAVAAVVFQPDLVQEIAPSSDTFYDASFTALMQAMYGDISIVTSNVKVNDLLSTGGMSGMLNTVWLVISAMVFGGVMEAAGFLTIIVKTLIKGVERTTSLVAATVGTCIFFNLTASEQYVAIVVPGRMFSDVYRKKGLAPELLSRTLEDSGTVTSVLVPWNSCGAYHAYTLGVSTMAYLPYCFFNLISPFMSIFVAAIAYKIKTVKPQIVK